MEVLQQMTPENLITTSKLDILWLTNCYHAVSDSCFSMIIAIILSDELVANSIIIGVRLDVHNISYHAFLATNHAENFLLDMQLYIVPVWVVMQLMVPWTVHPL